MRATTELIGPARRIPSTRSAACRVLSDGGLLPRCFQLATSSWLTSPLVCTATTQTSSGLHDGRRTKTDWYRQLQLRGSVTRFLLVEEAPAPRSIYASFVYLCWHCNWNTSATKVAFQEAHLKFARSRRQHVELLISLRSGRRARQGGDEKTAAWCVHAVL